MLLRSFPLNISDKIKTVRKLNSMARAQSSRSVTHGHISWQWNGRSIDHNNHQPCLLETIEFLFLSRMGNC